MSRFLVFPPLSVLVPAPVGTLAAVPPPASIRELFAFRQQSLERFAGSVVMTTGKALAVRKTLSAATATLDERPYEILAGIGALSIDEELVDRQSLDALGAQVFESDIEIPLIPPQPGEVVSAAAALPWHLESLDVQAARAKGLNGSGVLVGVLDTGIDATHPEFAHAPHFQEFAANGSPIPGGPHDTERHGTHVCGLIAGGTAGVATGATLAVGAVLTIPGAMGMSGTLGQIAYGMNWLLTEDFRGPNADPGVDVINLSLGVVGYDGFLYLTTQAARLAGILTVAAIGNEGNQGAGHYRSPGNYDLTLGVGAVDRHDRMWDEPGFGSSWGQVPQHGGIFKPDLAAPGAGVVSAVPGGSYLSMSGTSMATPLVTGACALLLERSPSLLHDAGALSAAILSLLRSAPSPRAGRGILDLGGI